MLKVHADWEQPTLTIDEMRVIVEEAHKQKRKVAACYHGGGDQERGDGGSRFDRTWDTGSIVKILR